MRQLVLSPGRESLHALGITRSWAKMEEFSVPIIDRIQPRIALTSIADLAVGLLGDTAAQFDQQVSKQNHLGFVSQYFDALVHGATQETYSDYARLLAAAAYYLSDYPGNAAVLARPLFRAPVDEIGLGELLRCFLEDPFKIRDLNLEVSKPFVPELQEAQRAIVEFIGSGRTPKVVIAKLDNVRNRIYKNGTPRQLMIVDLLVASIRRHVLRYSPWVTLPQYSQLPPERWQEFIAHRLSFRELWPSQLAIGECGIFAGRSGAIQVPTSGGKTKAVSILIRCAFLANRAHLALVVAPFNALCREIAADLQSDFRDDHEVRIGVIPDVRNTETNGLLNILEKSICVLTPEKLDYLLRADPGIATHIGLIVYDEGHLIDASSRGPLYELLLSSLKTRLSSSAQVVFISAVTPNITEIGKWLIGEQCKVVEGSYLSPTRRSVAMVNWSERKLQFVSPDNPIQDEFFVPRMFDEYKLRPRHNEKNPRFFPAIRINRLKANYRDPGHVGIVLACRLVRSGGVAIFCGRKDSVTRLARDTVESFDRGLPIAPPSAVCNRQELEKLSWYHDQLLGPESAATQASRLGILLHHGDTPIGARLCVEYAIQKQHAKTVICTSTLAQGVNLPIRYLLVAATSQGEDQITVRDFHNLIGRAGRAGKFTEGVIIFTDPRVYQAKAQRQWAWRNAEALLNPSLAGACMSGLLVCVSNSPEDPSEKEDWEGQVKHCTHVIESFLLLLLQDTNSADEAQEVAVRIAIQSLAYQQATEDQKQKLIELFKTIALEIVSKEQDPRKRSIFARSGVSLVEAKALAEQVAQKQTRTDFESLSELLAYWWGHIYPLIGRHIKNLPEGRALDAAQLWISGAPFATIRDNLSGLKYGNRYFSIEDCVNLCENGFGFHGSLLIGSIAELVGQDHATIHLLRTLQQALKIGLSESPAMAIYNELFADRLLALSAARVIGDISAQPIMDAVLTHREDLYALIRDYPAYFRWRLDEAIARLL